MIFGRRFVLAFLCRSTFEASRATERDRKSSLVHSADLCRGGVRVVRVRVSRVRVGSGLGL